MLDHSLSIVPRRSSPWQPATLARIAPPADSERAPRSCVGTSRQLQSRDTSVRARAKGLWIAHAIGTVRRSSQARGARSACLQPAGAPPLRCCATGVSNDFCGPCADDRHCLSVIRTSDAGQAVSRLRASRRRLGPHRDRLPQNRAACASRSRCGRTRRFQRWNLACLCRSRWKQQGPVGLEARWKRSAAPRLGSRQVFRSSYSA